MSGQANFGPGFELEIDAARERALAIDSCLQLAIAVLSIAAMYLIASDGPLTRWGFIIGLASQPFWFVATWRSKQLGMLLVAIFYTGAWVQGILNRFF